MRYVEALITNADSITKGNIYEVIDYNKENDTVTIINNRDEIKVYYVNDRSGAWFKCSTIHVRNDTIDRILR